MRVRALSSLGAGAWSDPELEALTKALVFPRPLPPRASVQGHTSVKLSWSTPPKTSGVAPMLFHHVRCSLVAATQCSPPPPPPPPPPPRVELTTPTPTASSDAPPADFIPAEEEPPPYSEPTPTPVHQPDIRFDAGWVATKPPDAGAGRASSFSAWPTAEQQQPSVTQTPTAPPPRRELNSVEVAQQGTLTAPSASGQGKTVYTGAATQAVIPGLLSGGKYACTLTVTNVVGESPPSDAVHFALPPPFGCGPSEPSPSPSPSPESFADALSRAMRQKRDDELREQEAAASERDPEYSP